MIATPVSYFSLFRVLCAWLAAVLASSGLRADESALRSQLDVPTSLKKSDAANAYRVLFVGDSITKHGTSPAVAKKLGWKHEAGMAASAEASDYVHVFASQLQAASPGRKVEIYYHTLGGSGSVLQRLAAVDQVKVVEPHLVIVQLGEHEKEADGVDGLRANYARLLAAFRDQPTPPHVIAVGPWAPILGNQNSRYNGWPGLVEDAMLSVAQEQGVPFVSVRDLADDPLCFGWGESPGVQWHPNDAGHTGYARKIFSAYQKLTVR